MYEVIIEKLIELGNILPGIAGSVSDIGIQKSWLTQKDLEIEDALSEVILKADPGAHIFAEEKHEAVPEARSIWIIDPISNTFNFIHGLPHYSLVISHMYEGVVIFAAIYDPSTKELFTASKAQGAFLNGKPIGVSKREDDLAVLLGGHLSPKSKYRDLTLELSQKLMTLGTLRTFGSFGLHYAYVACGRAEAAVAYTKDTFPEFAGKLLVEEAGGRFTDFSGGALTFKTDTIVASNGLVHERLLEMIKSSTASGSKTNGGFASTGIGETLTT